MGEDEELALHSRSQSSETYRKQLALSPMDRVPEYPSIIVKVASQDGRKLSFRIKRDTELIKLLLVFCERKEVSYRYMRFLYHGRRIRGKQTPRHLNMKDGDEIDAMTEQGGGAPSSGCCS
ncbi:hypothetical protein QN277_027532 [Acacia crassicarpa]|uniref:Ubiquitin-like domain-containing protein n=1 Tax=Acacia crassicarpa TaxID=499986 RepID=A0AAE1JDC6_9FABA|nr:hypothetical protein QN277_027532 [Acacia crassicarpa]